MSGRKHSNFKVEKGKRTETYVVGQGRGEGEGRRPSMNMVTLRGRSHVCAKGVCHVRRKQC